MAKQINCGICAISGDTIAMMIEQDHFKCPQCGATLYDNEDGNDKFIRDWRYQQQHISRSLPEGVHVHGGVDPVGTSGKERMKKQPISKLNFLLYRDK